MSSGVKEWLFDITTYFRFVSARRIDGHNSFFPSSIAAICAILICFLVIYGLFLWADPMLLAWLRQPDRQYPQIFNYITLLGKVNWILSITGIVLIFLSIINAKRFTGPKNLVWHRVFLNAYFIFTGITFSGLLGSLLKNIIGRARPDFTPDPHIWISMPFEHHYQFASFPSGHATTGGAIAMGLALLFPRWRWFFIVAGLLVAISRPVMGVHFISDIAGGLVFGGGFVWFYARLFARKRLLFKFNENGQLALRGEGRGKMNLLGEMARQVFSDLKLGANTRK
jgi:membrane-associated phospholipid phosphatase